MPRAGVSLTEPVSARARATASALPSPETRNQTSRVRLRALKVSEIRSGGGLGESGDRDGDLVEHLELGEAGEQRGDVAVGTQAQQDQVELAAAVLPHLLAVRRGGRVRSGVDLVGGRHGVHPGRVDPDDVEQVSPTARSLRSLESAGT